MIKVSLF